MAAARLMMPAEKVIFLLGLLPLGLMTPPRGRCRSRSHGIDRDVADGGGFEGVRPVVRSGSLSTYLDRVPRRRRRRGRRRRGCGHEGVPLCTGRIRMDMRIAFRAVTNASPLIMARPASSARNMPPGALPASRVISERKRCAAVLDRGSPDPCGLGGLAVAPLDEDGVGGCPEGDRVDAELLVVDGVQPGPDGSAWVHLEGGAAAGVLGERHGPRRGPSVAAPASHQSARRGRSWRRVTRSRGSHTWWGKPMCTNWT
jgi:hypothetical protein